MKLRRRWGIETVPILRLPLNDFMALRPGNIANHHSCLYRPNRWKWYIKTSVVPHLKWRVKSSDSSPVNSQLALTILGFLSVSHSWTYRIRSYFLWNRFRPVLKGCLIQILPCSAIFHVQVWTQRPACQGIPLPFLADSLIGAFQPMCRIVVLYVPGWSAVLPYVHCPIAR